MSIKPKKGSGNAKTLKEVAIESAEAFYQHGLISGDEYLQTRKVWLG